MEVGFLPHRLLSYSFFVICFANTVANTPRPSAPLKAIVLHSALRAPFAQQCFRLAMQQPAFAAGCSRAASLQLHFPLFSARCRTPALKGFVCAAVLSLARRET